MVRVPSFGRVDTSGRAALLAVGDALAIAAFVVAGVLQHGSTVDSGLLTYAEFLLGWAVAAVLLGAYARDAIDTWPRAAAIGFSAWFVGALLGQLVRSFVKPGFYVAPSFLLASIAFGGIAIVVWRVLASQLL